MSGVRRGVRARTAKQLNQVAATISIVTPSLNQGRFIERTIRSVLQQDVPELEYWIVDGGSDDQTIEILQRYDSRLLWMSEPDDGQAAAVNKGIDKSAGEIIGWLNSDDIYYPGALHRVLDLFTGEPEMSVIYGDANHIDESDEVIGPYETEAWSPERLKEVCFLCQPAVFFRRNLIERYGKLDEALDFCMDYEFWLRLASGGESFHYLPRLLAGSRLYPENKTLATRVSVHAEINDMLCRRFGRVPDTWIFNYGHAVCDSRGLSREEHRRYSMAVAARSLGASLRWNRRVSRQVLRKALHWIFMSLWKGVLKVVQSTLRQCTSILSRHVRIRGRDENRV